jgi:MFS family permease
MLFIVDFPPGIENKAAVSETLTPQPALTAPQLLRRREFWSLSLAFASVTMISTLLTAFIVPMAKDWAIDATRGASLLSIASIAGMAGTVVFGMLADRLGGLKVLIIVSVDTAILWGLILLKPPFAVLVPIVGLMGFHAASVTGVAAMTLSECFGQQGFGRAMGLSSMISLPFSVVSAPLAAALYGATGSFATPIAGMIGFLLLTTLFAATTPGSRSARTA